MKNSPGGAHEDVYFTKGKWRIVEFFWDSGSYMSMQHFCTAGRGNSIIPGWTGMFYHTRQMSEACYVCDKVPSDEIQGVWIMMTWDDLRVK